jgi:Meiotically up-regulated gene 113
MPLALTIEPGSKNFYVRGTHRGVYVKRTTGTKDRNLALEILAEAEGDINYALGTPYDPFQDVTSRLERARSDWTYLYCIQSLDHVKIGLADDPNKRLQELALGNPHEMRGVETWRVRKSSALIFEAAVHDILAECAVGREWFKTTPEAARAAVEQHNSTFDPPSEF